MTTSLTDRLNAINWFYKIHGWIASTDATWLRNWLGKDGITSELLKEAIEKHKIELITQRLIHGSNQTIQAPDLFPTTF